MPKITTEEKLRRLEEKQAKNKAEISRIKARLNQEKRKKDTRRKILIGSMVLAKKKEGNDKWWAEWLSALDNYLEKDRDRALFGLPPRD